MGKDKSVYGYVNGRPTYSRDEFIFAKRGFGAIETDEELMAFAEKVTHGWYSAGWNHSFTTFYLGDYAIDEPRASLTIEEFERLRELQRVARAAEEEAEAKAGWTLKETINYADNSVEEVWVDKDGNERRVQTVAPHGDTC